MLASVTGRGAWLVPQRPDNFHDDPHFQWMAGETDGCGPGPAGACPLPCFLARAVAQPALGSSVPGLFLCARPLAVTPLCLAPHASNGSRSPPSLGGDIVALPHGFRPWASRAPSHPGLAVDRPTHRLNPRGLGCPGGTYLPQKTILLGEYKQPHVTCRGLFFFKEMRVPALNWVRGFGPELLLPHCLSLRFWWLPVPFSVL